MLILVKPSVTRQILSTILERILIGSHSSQFCSLSTLVSLPSIIILFLVTKRLDKVKNSLSENWHIFFWPITSCKWYSWDISMMRKGKLTLVTNGFGEFILSHMVSSSTIISVRTVFKEMLLNQVKSGSHLTFSLQSISQFTKYSSTSCRDSKISWKQNRMSIIMATVQWWRLKPRCNQLIRLRHSWRGILKHPLIKAGNHVSILENLKWF